MTGTWMVISEAEKKVSNELVSTYFSEVTDFSSAIRILKNNADSIFKKIKNIKAPSAESESDISNNLIAQLAYAISEKINYNNSNGVVLTSHILAKDMVRMSLIEWLVINSNYPRDTIQRFVYGDEKWLLSDIEFTHKIVNIRWYDPCVGGGVFPIAIIDVLKSLGISVPPIIYGKDLNPLYIESTKIRIAITLDGDFNKNLEFIQSYYSTEDALDTFLPQEDIFHYESALDEFDIVVGNPPYVSGNRISPDAKNKYAKNYPQMRSKTADLYTYFIAHGLNALKARGVLTYVSPAQFQMSNYGKSIREDIESRAGLLTISDFNELPVFKNISSHISVYSLCKNYKPSVFLRYEYEELPDCDPLMQVYTHGTSLDQKNATAEGWNFSSFVVHDILTMLSSRGTTLREYSGGVYSGIKSSCKKAFFLKTAEIQDFLEYDLQFVKKMYIPKKIRRWHGEWSDEYFVVIKKDQVLDETSRIFHWMLQHKDELTSRSDIQNHSTWYGLRECNYYQELFSTKIIYPDIATECRFMMDKDGMCIPDGAFFIPKEDYYLLGVLNSCVARYYFKEKCARIGNPQKGGRIRFKKVYVENFPVVPPHSNPALAKGIEAIAQKATDDGKLDAADACRLDDMVLDLYQIPDEYKEIFKEG